MKISFEINNEKWELIKMLVGSYLYLTFTNGENKITLKIDYDDDYYPYVNNTPSLSTIYDKLYHKINNEEWE